MIHAIKEDTSLEIIVLKPGPARRVDLGPSRPGPGVGSGLSKKQPRIWPDETRSTRVNPTETQPYFFWQLSCSSSSRGYCYKLLVTWRSSWGERVKTRWWNSLNDHWLVDQPPCSTTLTRLVPSRVKNIY